MLLSKYIRLGELPSRIIIAIYLLATLFVRFVIEPQLQGSMLVSVGIGAFGMLFMYTLIKTGVLNPGWFAWEIKG